MSTVIVFVAVAQQPVDTAGVKRIIIEHADKLGFVKVDSVNQYQTLVGNVVARQENTLFYCDSAVLNQIDNSLEAFGRVHINDADSVHIYADYLKYLGKDKKAVLTGNVKLTDGQGILTTSRLDYNLASKIGDYSKGGKLVRGNTVLTSREGTYYEQTRDVFFKRDVVVNNPDYKITTDTLLYNTYSSITTFVAPTLIISDSGRRKINTSDGYYDLQNKFAYFGKRPEIQDKSTFLTGDEVAMDDSTGFGEARGNVIYKDTAQKVSVFANHMNSSRNDNSFLAREKPVMMIVQEKDSIFVAADILYSARLSDLKKTRPVPVIRDSTLSTLVLNDSSDRFFEAYHNVRIFSDSLQAVCDSLFYSGEDSAFRLFTNPVIWAQNGQTTGDTIYIFTKNRKPERMTVFENAITLNQLNDGYFNQLRGRVMDTYFSDGEIEHVRTKGNAESVYYAQDDDNRYIGVNKANSDIVDIYFKDRKPSRVVFRSNLTGTTYPMRQVNHEELRLRGFSWKESLRPKSKYELFAD